MSIFIPIFDLPEAGVPVAGVFAGNTLLEGEAELEQHMGGFLNAATTIVGSLTVVGSVSGTLVGNTALSGFLRKDGEPNIFFGGSLGGNTELVGLMSLVLAGTGIFAGTTELEGVMAVTNPDEASLFIFVDILDTAIAAARDARIRRYMPRLLVNGAPVAIRRATLEAASNTLGTELRVTLLEPDTSVITFESTIDFQIGTWTGAAFNYITVMAGGKLSARDNPIQNDDGRPNDEVNISIIDILADRWNRAPRVPIHIFDPLLVSAPTQSHTSTERIQVWGGGYLEPINIPIAGLSLFDVINYAYIAGTGFDSIITNIPNFPVMETDFTLDGGYDGGVRSLLAPFSPLLFERSNVLFIVDPDAPLPAGFAARVFSQSETHSLTQALPQREPVNAILVETQEGQGGDYYTERLDQEYTETSTFGQPDFTETDIVRRIREWRTFADPATVLREELVNEVTTVHNADFQVIEETTVLERFDVMGRKTGHTRRTDKRMPDINNNGLMTLLSDVTRQEQIITYRPDPLDPSQDVQDMVTTVESGLVLTDNANSYLGESYRIPLIDAHISGYVDPDGSQTVGSATIRTTTESLRVRGDQIDTETRVINHLAGDATKSAITTRPGAVVVNRRRQQARKTYLLTVDGTATQGRRTPVLNAGSLPLELAIQLGYRKLRQLNSPPNEIQHNPAFVDLSLKRGTILAMQGRGNVALGNYMVMGYTITFAEYQQNIGCLATEQIKLRALTT